GHRSDRARAALGDVPVPELHDVAVRVGDVGGAGPAAELDLVDGVAVGADALHDSGVVLPVDVHGVVDVHAAAAAGDADLGEPEADAGVAGQYPYRFAVVPLRPGPAFDDGEAEHPAVEALRGLQVPDLQDELVDAVHRCGHGSSSCPRRAARREYREFAI